MMSGEKNSSNQSIPVLSDWPVAGNPFDGIPTNARDDLIKRVREKNLNVLKTWQMRIGTAKMKFPTTYESLIPIGCVAAIKKGIEDIEANTGDYPNINTHVILSPPPAINGQTFADEIMFNPEFSINEFPTMAISEDGEFAEMIEEAKAEMQRNRDDKILRNHGNTEEKDQSFEDINSPASSEEDITASLPGLSEK